MTKKTRSTVAGLLGFSLVFSSFAGVQAQSASDIAGHWAQPRIQQWVDNGLLHGYQDGSFRPNQTITRAEFVTMINRLFDLEKTPSPASSFKDVSPDNWAYAEITTAVQQGYLQGYQDQTFRPNVTVTRQEAAAMITSLLDLQSESAQSLDHYADANQIAGWAKSSMAAVIHNGILQGYPNQTLAPNKSLSRAEAIVLIDSALAKHAELTTTVYDQAGTYGPATGKEIITGNVIIQSADVKLQNIEITGNLTFAEGIGEGDVVVDHVTVKGTTHVKGGGKNSIHLVDTTTGIIIVNKANGTVRIVAEGSTVAGQVFILSSALLEESGLTGAGFTDVELSESLPANAKVQLMGVFDDVNVLASAITLELQKGAIGTLNILEGANHAKIELGSGAEVQSLILDAIIQVLGLGTVKKATINEGAQGSSFNKRPQSIDGVHKDQVQAPPPSTGGGIPGGGNGGGNNGGNEGNPGGGQPIETDAQKVARIKAAILALELVWVYDGAEATVKYIEDKLGSINLSNVRVLVSANETQGAIITIQSGSVTNTIEIEAEADIANVIAIEALRGALIDDNIENINLLENISGVDRRIDIARTVSLNGNNKTISFANTIKHGVLVTHNDVTVNNLSLSLNSTHGQWDGVYGLQVYNAKNVTLSNYKAAGGDAALLVNSSTVTLEGNIDVSHNEYGGIEVSKSQGNSNLPESTLFIEGMLLNSTESLNSPTVWVIDGQGSINLDRAGTPLTSKQIASRSQTYYYLNADLAVTAEVSTHAQLLAAIENDAIEIIKVTADIPNVTDTITISRKVSLNGNGHTINFTEGIKDGLLVNANDVNIEDLKLALRSPDGWQGSYGIHVYNATDVTIKDYTANGGDAALLINGSNVALEGTIDVSGNEYGGIEVSKGKTLSKSSVLHVDRASFINSTEHMGNPTIWLEQDEGSISSDSNFTVAQVVHPSDRLQTHYFLRESSKTAVHVSTAHKLKEGIANPNVETIRLAGDIDNVSETLIISRQVKLDGNGHTIHFTGGIKDGLLVNANDVKVENLKLALRSPNGWQGSYGIQVYKATGVTIRDFKASGADAALLVNGSSVTLDGRIDVTGNEFGGIEVSMGKGLTDKSELILQAGIELVNDSENNDNPTIWVEEVQGIVIFSGDILSRKEVTTPKTQTHYFINPVYVVPDNLTVAEPDPSVSPDLDLFPEPELELIPEPESESIPDPGQATEPEPQLAP